MTKNNSHKNKGPKNSGSNNSEATNAPETENKNSAPVPAADDTNSSTDDESNTAEDNTATGNSEEGSSKPANTETQDEILETLKEVAKEDEKEVAAPIPEAPLEAEKVTYEEAKFVETKKPVELPEQLKVLANSIENLFKERDETSLPKLIEEDVKKHTANAALGVDIQYHYTNDEKTAGHITLKEFEHEVRVPATGEFTFGIDYSKGR